jgi:predicted alpha/beta-hydrolase family hydrolase
MSTPEHTMEEPLTIDVEESGRVGALLGLPRKPSACFVFAHGAGAGMRQAFMTAVAGALHDRGIATLRYQFPYMERGSRRPDSPKVAHAAVRAAAALAAQKCPGVPIVAGGKSFGGRMTSQAQAASPIAGVRGLAFLGFPLHPAGKPSIDRADHLFEVSVPMLFVQGALDKLADKSLLVPLVSRLGARAALHLFPEADHSLHVPARSGRKDADVIAETADVFVQWCGRVGAA